VSTKVSVVTPTACAVANGDPPVGAEVRAKAVPLDAQARAMRTTKLLLRRGFRRHGRAR
jgi:hypothetical protein